MVVLAQPQSMAPGWIVRVNDSRMLRLEPLVRTDVPPQKALQLWTKADGWKGPVSLGLVTPGRPYEVRLDKLPPLQPNQLFEITLEPANGSPIGRPTGPILFIGRAVKTM
jgi:anti-sigma-K factor RskA